MFPKYSWKSDIEIVKQGLAPFLGLLANTVLIVIFVIISIMVQGVSLQLILVVQAICFTSIAIGLFIWLAQQQLYIKAKA